MESLKNLIPEPPGLIVNPSEKLEIKPTVVHVGPLVPSPPWVIESVLLLTKLFKPESQPLIYYLAVDSSPAVWDAMVVILQVLGNIGLTVVLSLVTYMETTNGVNLILWNLVTIMLMEPTDLALLVLPLQAALQLVSMVLISRMINTLVLATIQFHQTLLPSKLKSWPTDLLKLPSPSMKTSQLIEAVYINTLLDHN